MVDVQHVYLIISVAADSLFLLYVVSLSAAYCQTVVVWVTEHDETLLIWLTSFTHNTHHALGGLVRNNAKDTTV